MRAAGAFADIVAVILQRSHALALALAMLAATLSLGAEAAKVAAAGSAAAGKVVETLSVHLALAGMKAAASPRVVDGDLILSAAGPYRAVSAAFAHEGFARLHGFERNGQGVFVLAYPVPLNRSEDLEYRLVIDGVWTLDPANPESRSDASTGIQVSVARVPYISDLKRGVYKIMEEDGRVARFLFQGVSGEYVTVCGDFDNWDPFIHEMAETSPGIYELELPLPPGTHYYTFVYRGQSLPDPLNPDRAANRDGKLVSVLVAN